MKHLYMGIIGGKEEYGITWRNLWAWGRRLWYGSAKCRFTPGFPSEDCFLISANWPQCSLKSLTELIINTVFNNYDVCPPPPVFDSDIV